MTAGESGACGAVDPVTSGTLVPLLEARGVCKSYAVRVLDGFDLDLHPGEVHALMGANGAGKSTFARIVCGLTSPDGGSMHVSGRPHAPRSKRDGEAAGVVMVLQELNVVPTLSVAENLFLDRLPSRLGFIDRARLDNLARTALERVGMGKGILVVSSELEELMNLCDRILVMSLGRIAAGFAAGEWTQEKINAAAFSGHHASPP